ncbi:MAG: ATP synthase F1 subunit epsilon [bacterium]
MSTLHLEIVTPETRVFSGNASFVVVPGVEGGLGILPDHMPLLTQILPGELRVTTDEGEMLLAVGEGFLEIRPDRVSVLTDMALKDDEIDETAAEEAVTRAEQQISKGDLSDEELATVQSSLLRSLAQLHVKRRMQL